MRAHDWAATTLGVPEDWPQSLKGAIRLILNTQHPMYIWWGDELLCFYNDAYRPSIGSDRHPQSLGQPGRAVWAEIWSQIGPQVEQVMRGEGGTWAVDAQIPITRDGRREEVYWTYSYSPIHEDDSASGVGGVLVICHETTERVLEARRRETLAQFDQRLHDVTDPGALAFAASRILGEALGAMRVGYGELDHARRTVTVERAWSADGHANISGTYAFADFGSYIDEMLRGEIVVNLDVATDVRTRGHVHSFQALAIAAHVDVPVVEEGFAVAQMFVHAPEPRRWSDEEVAFISEVARRTRAAITRRTAEQALRSSEERFRLLADTIAEVFYVRNLDTGRVEYISPAYARVWQQSIEALYADATIYQRAIHPEDQATALAAFARQPLGENTDVRYRLLRDDGAIVHIHDRAFVVPHTRDGARRVVGLAEDVTETTSARVALRQALDDKDLLIRGIDHRVANSLAMIGSLLSLQRSSARERETQIALDAAAARVVAIARIHDRLHKAKVTGTVEFDEYIGGLCHDIDRTVGGEHVSVKLTAETLELPVETAVPLGIIANELITNACKHCPPAYRAMVTVMLNCDDRNAIPVVDSASAMPVDFDPKKTTGLGLRVIAALTKQIGGQIRYPDAGARARFAVTVPLTQS